MNEKHENAVIIKNSILSVGIKGIDYLLSFLSGTLLLSCLGDVKYGIYASALSLISWIYYFDLGVGSGMRNKVTEYVTIGNKDQATKTVSTAYAIVSGISICLFLVFFLFAMFVDFETLLNASVPDENLNFILTVSLLIACVNFIVSLSINVLWSVQKTALANGIGIASKWILVIALFIFKLTGVSAILYVVIAEGIGQLIKNLIAFFYVNKKVKYLSPHISKIDFSCSKGILGFGVQIFIMQISALVLNATDNLIIMKLFGAQEVTPYSFTHKFFSIFNAIFIAATSPLWTAYTIAYTGHDVGYIKKTLKRALIFYCITLLGIIIGVIIFKPFMGLYLGKDLEYQNGLIIITAIYYALLILSHNFSALVHGISKVKLTTIGCMFSAIQNIPVSIFLARNCGLGLNGVILGSIIGLVISTSTYIYTAFKEIKRME